MTCLKMLGVPALESMMASKDPELLHHLYHIVKLDTFFDSPESSTSLFWICLKAKGRWTITKNSSSVLKTLQPFGSFFDSLINLGCNFGFCAFERPLWGVLFLGPWSTQSTVRGEDTSF